MRSTAFIRRVASIVKFLAMCVALEIPVTLALFVYQLSRTCNCAGPGIDEALTSVGIDQTIALAILYTVAPALCALWSWKHKSPPMEGRAFSDDTRE